MNRVPDPILAMIFGHNLDYYSYSLVCKRWKAVLDRFPAEVWRRKIAETLKAWNFKFKEFIFIDHPMFKAFHLKPKLKYFVGWIYSIRKVKIQEATLMTPSFIKLGKMQYGPDDEITLREVDKNLDDLYVHIFRGNYCMRIENSFMSKLVEVFQYNYLNQYIWSGRVIDTRKEEDELMAIPHGPGTATVNGTIYRNVYAFLGCLDGDEDSYPNMTKKLKTK